MLKKVGKFLGSPWGQRVLLLVLICIFMAFFEPRFFRPSNWSSILLAISICGIMACGMLFSVLLGGIDLSVGSMAGLAAVVFALIYHRNGGGTEFFILGLAAGIAVSAVFGALHGVLVSYVKMPAFVVTLATQYVILAVNMIVNQGKYVNSEDKGLFYLLGNGQVFGIPMPIVIFVIYAAIAAVLLGCTTYGRRIYAVGGNTVAAGLVGIKTNAVTIVAFIITSVSAGIGGMILGSMNMQVGSTTASGYQGNVLMAMIVGGINLAGGEGGVPGAVFGALLVGIINNVQTLIGVPSDYQGFVQGVIIILAISLNIYTSRKSKGLIPPRHKKAAVEAK